MRLLLAGATGFIGSALVKSLADQGHEMVVLTRQAARENHPGIRVRYRYWNPAEEGLWEKEVGDAEGIINLAGESIMKRWTAAYKQKILSSRVETTQAIVKAIQRSQKKPSFLINASAIGFYGPRGDEEITEDSPHGNDFLADVCKAWEAHALRAQDFKVRVALLRIGIVLEKGGGALAKMLLPFQLGLGGPVGSGSQWMSWIHLKDLIGIISFVLEKSSVSGPVNATAPNPVRMREFARTLGNVLHRPAFLPAPAFALRIVLGEMSNLILTGQHVLPRKILGAGYRFRFPTLKEAFQEILKK